MSRYSLVVETEPGGEPVTRGQAAVWCKIDSTDADEMALLDALIQASREWCENYCRRSFAKRTLKMSMDVFPDVIYLPRGPVLSLTSLKYINQSGVLTDVDTAIYQTDFDSVPGRIALNFGSVWPIPKFGAINAVQVIYDAGYSPDDSGSPTDFGANVPAAIKAAMRQLIEHWYDHRSAVELENVQALEVPFTVKAVLSPYEIRDFTLE